MMRYYTAILLLLLLPWKISGQVRGLSASKIAAYNAQTVASSTVEFEPQLSTGWSDMLWNSEGERVPRFPMSDSVERFTSVDFRITYGIADGFEAGVFVTGDYELLSIGLKKRVLNGESLSLAALAGFNYAAGNGIVSVSRRGLESHSSLPVGLAGTYTINAKASIDADIQVEPALAFKDGMNKTAHYYLNMDAGYYPMSSLQLITGFSLVYGTRDFSGPRGYQLIINPGITIETGRNFIIVLATPFCVAGKTHYCFRSLQMALTLAFQ